MRSTIHSSMGALFYCAIFVWQPTNKKGYWIKQLKVLNVEKTMKNNFCKNETIVTLIFFVSKSEFLSLALSIFNLQCILQDFCVKHQTTCSMICRHYIPNFWWNCRNLGRCWHIFCICEILQRIPISRKKNWGECWLGCNT